MSTVNVWANVGGTTFTLVMEALYGTSNQLLGMNTGATALQYKEATYNNTTHQFAVPVGSAAVPSFTWQGDLDTGFYQDGANALGIAAGGTKRIGISTTRLTSAIEIALDSKLLMEDMGADIAAAATTDLGNATGNYLQVTNTSGATTITSLGGATLPAGTEITTKFVISGGSISITYNATSMVLIGGANLAVANGDVAIWRKVNDASAYWQMISYQRATGVAKGGLLRVTVMVATATWTAGTNTNSVEVEIVGAGGGGGGAGAGGGATVSSAGGGGTGGLAREFILTPTSTVLVTIGAKGVGGAAGLNGTSGTGSSFGAYCSATGGTFGVGSAAAAVVGFDGGTSGIGSGGDTNIRQDNGDSGWGLGVLNLVKSGRGGNSKYGAGGKGLIAGGTGNNGTGNGSGGSGAAQNNGQPGGAGGDGTDGIAVIWEFS